MNGNRDPWWNTNFVFPPGIYYGQQTQNFPFYLDFYPNPGFSQFFQSNTFPYYQNTNQNGPLLAPQPSIYQAPRQPLPPNQSLQHQNNSNERNQGSMSNPSNFTHSDKDRMSRRKRAAAVKIPCEPMYDNHSRLFIDVMKVPFGSTEDIVALAEEKIVLDSVYSPKRGILHFGTARFDQLAFALEALDPPIILQYPTENGVRYRFQLDQYPISGSHAGQFRTLAEARAQKRAAEAPKAASNNSSLPARFTIDLTKSPLASVAAPSSSTSRSDFGTISKKPSTSSKHVGESAKAPNKEQGQSTRLKEPSKGLSLDIPGFTTVQHLTKPYSLVNSSSTTGKGFNIFDVRLSTPEAWQLRQPKSQLKVILRLVAERIDRTVDSKERNPLILIEDLKINGKPLKLRKKEAHRFNIDITGLIRSKLCSEIKLWTCVPKPSDKKLNFWCYASLVKGLEPGTMLKTLADGDKIPKDVTKGLIAKTFWAAEKDGILSETKVKVSLQCPLGKVKIRVPARGVHCTHYKCFDALNFLQTYYNTANVWVCPLCDTHLDYEDLRIDSYFEEVLQTIEESEDPHQIDVQISSDGSLLFFSAKPKSNLSTESNLANQAADAGNNTINLDDDEIGLEGIGESGPEVDLTISSSPKPMELTPVKSSKIVPKAKTPKTELLDISSPQVSTPRASLSLCDISELSDWESFSDKSGKETNGSNLTPVQSSSPEFKTVPGPENSSGVNVKDAETNPNLPSAESNSLELESFVQPLSIRDDMNQKTSGNGPKPQILLMDYSIISEESFQLDDVSSSTVTNKNASPKAGSIAQELEGTEINLQSNVVDKSQSETKSEPTAVQMEFDDEEDTSSPMSPSPPPMSRDELAGVFGKKRKLESSIEEDSCMEPERTRSLPTSPVSKKILLSTFL